MMMIFLVVNQWYQVGTGNGFKCLTFLFFFTTEGNSIYLLAN